MVLAELRDGVLLGQSHARNAASSGHLIQNKPVKRRSGAFGFRLKVIPMFKIPHQGCVCTKMKAPEVPAQT